MGGGVQCRRFSPSSGHWVGIPPRPQTVSPVGDGRHFGLGEWSMNGKGARGGSFLGEAIHRPRGLPRVGQEAELGLTGVTLPASCAVSRNPAASTVHVAGDQPPGRLSAQEKSCGRRVPVCPPHPAARCFRRDTNGICWAL